jgi:mono/diheme cytochrome c family protein
MKRLSISACAIICLLAGCESAGYAPPPVTAQMATTGPRPVNFATLQRGRAIFVSRCIECHTLPPVSSHSASAWPRLVDEMAERASLKPAEGNALVAYLQAAATK